MAYTAPTTRTTGELISASDWNTDVADNITFLANPPACRVFNDVDLNLADNTLTKLTFGVERFDTDSMHSTSTNSGRITFNTAGVYVVGFGVRLSAATYSNVQVLILLNNLTYIARERETPGGANNEYLLTTGYKFAAGDYIEAQVVQTSGATATAVANGNFSPEFWAVWVGRG